MPRLLLLHKEGKKEENFQTRAGNSCAVKIPSGANLDSRLVRVILLLPEPNNEPQPHLSNYPTLQPNKKIGKRNKTRSLFPSFLIYDHFWVTSRPPPPPFSLSPSSFLIVSIVIIIGEMASIRSGRNEKRNEKRSRQVTAVRAMLIATPEVGNLNRRRLAFSHTFRGGPCQPEPINKARLERTKNYENS